MNSALRFLTLLIIVGLSATLVQAQTVTTESPLDPMEFSYLTLWKYAETECVKKGINGSEITKSWIGVRACLRTKLDVVQFNLDSLRLDLDTQSAILEKHCPKLRTATDCFDPFMETVKRCVPEGNYEIFEALQHWVADVLDYICKDNGAQIKYDKAKHEKCAREVGAYIFECAAQNIIAKEYDDRKSFNEEDCRMLVRVRDCLVNKLSDCSVFSASAQLFYDNFIHITSCAR
ncbi:uncharacterized protein LOC129723624 isoform X2 [Wyeomyia smithii]|uniref:uncharacterized protein LOC129723624 isoform X2 n=1 Tax=Wyeomyia smithii TaxID=174621 RepID=UPI0024680253|nr:uncharacterized protein LOC129723624 isoform X2 [Wyeomyia smithii]